MSEVVIVSAVRTPIGKYDLIYTCCDVHTTLHCAHSVTGPKSINRLDSSAILQVLGVFLTSCTSVVKSRRRGCLEKH